MSYINITFFSTMLWQKPAPGCQEYHYLVQETTDNLEYIPCCRKHALNCPSPFRWVRHRMVHRTHVAHTQHS